MMTSLVVRIFLFVALMMPAEQAKGVDINRTPQEPKISAEETGFCNFAYQAITQVRLCNFKLHNLEETQENP